MKTRTEIIKVHPDWRVVCMAELSEVINCAGCGKAIDYGHCYTSLERFSDSGLWGLAVCPKCYDAEMCRRFMEVD